MSSQSTPDTVNTESVQVVDDITVVSGRYDHVSDKRLESGLVSFSIPASFLRSVDITDCHSLTMMVHATNPYKSGVDSLVSSLTLYDCDDKELTHPQSSSAAVSIQLPLQPDLSVSIHRAIATRSPLLISLSE